MSEAPSQVLSDGRLVLRIDEAAGRHSCDRSALKYWLDSSVRCNPSPSDGCASPASR